MSLEFNTSFKKEVCLGLSRKVDVSNDNDWAELLHEISTGKVLPDPPALDSVRERVFAVSYKQGGHFIAKVGDRWMELRRLVLGQLRGKSKTIRVWMDQVANKRQRDGSWAKYGLLPYSLFDTVRLTDVDGSDSENERAYNRLWLSLEHQIASTGPGYIKQGGRKDVCIVKKGDGETPLVNMKDLATRILNGQFDNKEMSWEQDYID